MFKNSNSLHITVMIINDLTHFDPILFNSQIRDSIAERYGRVWMEKDFGLFNALDQIVGDLDFTCDVEEFAERLSKNGNSVYRYTTFS